MEYGFYNLYRKIKEKIEKEILHSLDKYSKWTLEHFLLLNSGLLFDDIQNLNWIINLRDNKADFGFKKIEILSVEIPIFVVKKMPNKQKLIQNYPNTLCCFNKSC